MSNYDERKTAQAAALLLKWAGGSEYFLKVLKLLYLAERLSFQRYGYSLSGDHFVSMKNGPVLSITYDLLKGERQSKAGGWDTWIDDEADHKVGLSSLAKETASFDELSESDKEVLLDTFNEFGGWDRWDLVAYTHKLPEWQDPGFSSSPIAWKTLFSAIGYSEETAAALEEQLLMHRQLAKQFA